MPVRPARPKTALGQATLLQKRGVSPDYARNDDTNGWIDQGRDGRWLSDSEVLDPS
jgi:hypothetical protein